MARVPPFRCERVFDGVKPSNDISSRLEYVAHTPHGRTILENMCKYDIPKAFAFFFRHLWGVRAPVEFRSVQSDGSTVWDFASCPPDGAVYNRHAMSTPHAKFIRLSKSIVSTMDIAISQFQGEYLANHAMDLFNVYPRVPTLTDEVESTARGYIEKEIRDIIDHVHHERAIDALKRCPIDVPKKYNVFESRVPTDDVEARLKYLVETDDGRAIVEDLKDLRMTKMPLYIFKKLWGREAPEHFQSFLPTKQCIYECIDTGAIDAHYIYSRTARDLLYKTPLVAKKVTEKLALRFSNFLVDFLETLANDTDACDDDDPLTQIRYATIPNIQVASNDIRDELIKMVDDINKKEKGGLLRGIYDARH